MRLLRLTLTAATAAVAVTPLVAQAALTTATTTEDAALAAAVRATVTTPSVTAATSGIAVRDLTTGKLVYTRNATTPIAPASTAKNRTVGAALSLLGPGYRWHTDVLARGTRTGGVLNGPLVVKGYGDPTLMRSDLAALAQKVRAAGITQVSGIVTDDTWFDTVRRNPAWNSADFASYYAAPISALTMGADSDHDLATAIVRYAPGTVGGRASVTTIPAAAASYLKIVNYATTGAVGTGDTVRVSQPVNSGIVTVSGRVAAGRAAQQVLTVTPSPQMYVGTVLRAELAAAGVTVRSGLAPGRAASTDVLVARDTSEPLSTAIVPLLKLSNNMMAETVLKTISAQAGGGGTWPDGTARVRAWMTRSGIPMTNVRIVDGSGLAKTNRETALSEAGLLWTMRWNTPFHAALPVAGNPDRMIGGTLRKRLVGTAAANNLHAKTGTLTGVTALSGYVRTANGRRLSMSMISAYTGTSPRPVENALGLTLARWSGGGSTTSSLTSISSGTSLTRTTTSTGSSAQLPGTDTTEWTKRSS